MASAVAELEAGLNAMQNLKPPGVSGSRITTLTALCVNNVQVRQHAVSCAHNAAFLHADKKPHVVVRVRTHSENLHSFQKGPSNPQTGSALCRRFRNSQMGRSGETTGPAYQ